MNNKMAMDHHYEVKSEMYRKNWKSKDELAGMTVDEMRKYFLDTIYPTEQYKGNYPSYLWFQQDFDDVLEETHGMSFEDTIAFWNNIMEGK